MKNDCEKCYSCKHFIQHYGISKELQIFPIYCGHCNIGDFKLKPNCNNYKQGSNLYFREQMIYFSAIYDKYAKKIESLKTQIQSIFEHIIDK